MPLQTHQFDTPNPSEYMFVLYKIILLKKHFMSHVSKKVRKDMANNFVSYNVTEKLSLK